MILQAGVRQNTEQSGSNQIQIYPLECQQFIWTKVLFVSCLSFITVKEKIFQVLVSRAKALDHSCCFEFITTHIYTN